MKKTKNFLKDMGLTESTIELILYNYIDIKDEKINTKERLIMQSIFSSDIISANDILELKYLLNTNVELFIFPNIFKELLNSEGIHLKISTDLFYKIKLETFEKEKEKTYKSGDIILKQIIIPITKITEFSKNRNLHLEIIDNIKKKDFSLINQKNPELKLDLTNNLELEVKGIKIGEYFFNTKSDFNIFYLKSLYLEYKINTLNKYRVEEDKYSLPIPTCLKKLPIQNML